MVEGRARVRLTVLYVDVGRIAKVCTLIEGVRARARERGRAKVSALPALAGVGRHPRGLLHRTINRLTNSSAIFRPSGAMSESNGPSNSTSEASVRP